MINTSETTSTGPVHIQLRSGGNSVFALNAPDGVILQPGEMLSFSLTCRPRWQGNATASIQISEGSGTTRPVMFNVWATVGDNLAVLPSAGIGQIGTTVKLAFLRDGYSPYYSATYQWLHDGTPVPGATAASFSLKIASLADAGAYTCRVKGSTGLTLDTAPVAIVVTSGGIRLDKLSNGLATLDLLFAGKPDSIQWMKNDVAAGNDATVKLAVKPDDVIKCVLTLGTATATYTTSQIALTPAPVVLPATFAWTTASDVSAQLATSGAPLQFSITGLPAGVTYDTRTGVLTGRPRLPGRYTLRAAASNAAGLGPVRAIVATVTGTPQIVSANLCGSWAARLGRDDAVTSGTGGQVYFSVLANGAMTGTLTTGQAFPETRTSVVPSSAEHWANGALLTRFIGAFHASASGPFVADVPFRLSLPVRGAMMVLHLELASTGTITGALRYRDAGALIDLGGLVNRNTSATISRIAVTMLPALSDVPVAVTCGPYSMWVESFADQSKRFASTVALADGQLLLFRPALEYDGSGNKTGVSTLSAAMRLSPSQQQLQGSATSGNSLREVITHVISGVVTH